jgi:arylsulfatase
MELAGATLPADRKLDGISLASLLLHEQPLPPRKLFWAQGKDWVMRDGPWKLLHERDAMYLFDLGKDLGEQHDLSAQFPERVKTMHEDFQAWAKDVGTGRAEGSTPKRVKGKAAKGEAERAVEE